MARINFEISDEEFQKFKRKCFGEGVSMSAKLADFIRSLIGEVPVTPPRDMSWVQEMQQVNPPSAFEVKSSNPRAQKLKGDLKRYEESLKVISENLPKEVEAKEAIDLGGLKYEKEEF